jgi:hypothetical protein
MPCRAHAVLLPCHAVPLPVSDSAVSFVKVRVVAGNIRTASPTVWRIGMLLSTTFVELRVVSGRSQTLAGRPHAVSGRLILIHTCHTHAAPMPNCAVALRSRFKNGMVVAWHGRGMACVNQTRPHCVNQMTHNLNLSGTAWERRGMCELALSSHAAVLLSPWTLRH